MRIPLSPADTRTSARRSAGESDPLRGKVALITGAANGIGAATARALAGRGGRLLLTDIDDELLQELAAELNDRHGGATALGVAADVRDLTAMTDAVARAVETFGAVDLVVANAGIASYGSVAAVDPATFRAVLDVNVTGVFHTVRAALPELIRRRGYVLVVSSLAAFAPSPGLAAYNASKAGVEHFANALRLEVAHQGVEVGTAHMSWIDTPLVRDASEDLSAFADLIRSLPAPLNRTADVDVCVAAFVDGLAHRRRRVYAPGWVRGLSAARGLVTSRFGDRATRDLVPRILPRMDAEVAQLHRSTSARNVDHGVCR